MTEKEIISEIIRYLSDTSYNYAVMIDGNWGCGKTYFVNHGLSDAIKEKEKTFEKKRQLSQEAMDSINEILFFLKEKKIQDFTLCYFQIDESKKGGSYKVLHATSVNFFETEKFLIVNEQYKISFSDIYSIDCDEYYSSKEES